MQGHFNVVLATIHASKVHNEAHELIRERRDGCNFTGERPAHLNEGNRMTISRQKRERLSVSHRCILQLEFPCHY